MVTIINFKERQKEDGSSFCVLEVQGGIEMVKSQVTGNYYATAQKALIPSTFDPLTCKALVGTQMPGRIEKVPCEAFEYTIRETGEIVSLNHRYGYVLDDETVSKPNYENLSPAIRNFSMNTNPHLKHVN
jgi:hypothetical protein